MQVATWFRGTPDQTSRNSGNKYQLARPLTCQISSRLVKRCTRKSVTMFTPFSILAHQGDSLHQSSPIWVMTYSKPPLSSRQISSRSVNPSRRYLLPKFVDFVDGVTFILTKNSKRCRPIVCALPPCGDYKGKNINIMTVSFNQSAHYMDTFLRVDT